MYRPDELQVLKGQGIPSASRDTPTLYVDLLTGQTYLNSGGGTTWTAFGAGNQETLTAARVLTAGDSGKTFFLNLAGGFDVTLPALTVTGSFKFIVLTAPTTAYTITGATADKIVGHVLSSSGGAEDHEDTAGGDVVNFIANTAVIGDEVTITMNGTLYFASCKCAAAGGITITG